MELSEPGRCKLDCMDSEISSKGVSLTKSTLLCLSSHVCLIELCTENLVCQYALLFCSLIDKLRACDVHSVAVYVGNVLFE